MALNSSVMYTKFLYSGFFLYIVLFPVSYVCGNTCFFWSSSFYFKEHCYKLSSYSSNWQTAQLQCKIEISRGQLLELMSDDVIDFLSYNFSLSGQDWWTGGVVKSTASDIVTVWSSTSQAINSTRTSSSGTGSCVQLTDYHRQATTPVLEKDDCSKNKKFICELYVGNPCVKVLPKGNYFDGYCQEIQGVLMYWADAQELCRESKARMAEFHTIESYSFAKSMVERDLAREIYIAANSTYFLDTTVLLGGMSYYSFRIAACRDVKVYLWGSNTKSKSTIGGPTGKYYEINFGKLNEEKATVKFCQDSLCQVLDRATGVNFTCTKFLDSSITWTGGLTVSEPKLSVASPLPLNINQMAVSIGNSRGLGVFQDSLMTSDIFLGSNDSLIEGNFTWMSDGQPMTFYDWLGGQPDNWQGYNGEDNLEWRTVSQNTVKLNDINGTQSPARPFCQKDTMRMTYLIVLPDYGSGSVVLENQIVVTSGEEEVTYLRFTRRLNDGTADVRADWVTSYRPSIYTIDNGVKMGVFIGLHRGVVKLTSTNHVTVVVYFRSASTLVFPVQMLTPGYFVVSPAAPTPGTRLTITALENETDVTIRFPRNTTQHFTVKVTGLEFQQPRFLTFTLKTLESAQLLFDDDFSGEFIYATKPVAVYIGHMQDSMHSNVDMVIPVDSLSSHYVTFPSSVSTAASSRATYRLLSLYDDTSIKVHTNEIQTVTILKAGCFQDLNLPLDGFIFLQSDEQHPFYVIKLSPTASCVTSLLPLALWRSGYDVYVKDPSQTVFIIISLDQKTAFTKDDIPFDLTDCTVIKGTSFVGCSIALLQGMHHIGFKNQSVTFAAYASQVSGDDLEYCHSLGSSEAFSDLLGRNLSFPALKYLALDDDEPFTVFSTPGTVFVTTSSAALSKTTITTNPAAPTESPTPISEGSSSSPVTTTMTPTSQPTVSSSIPASQTAAAATGSGNVTVCFPFHLPVSNMSEDSVSSLLRSIIEELTVSYKSTLAYRGQKSSMWDSRISSMVIGTSGVAVMVVWGVIITSSDISSLLRHIFLLIKRSLSPYSE